MTTGTGLAAFTPQTLVWLAAVPEWTDVLAVQVGLAQAGQLPALLDRLEDAGLVERRDDLTADGEPCEVFWLRSRMRATVIQHTADRLRSRMLETVTQDSAERGVYTAVTQWVDDLRRAVDPNAPGDSSLASWAYVATLMRGDGDGAGLRLLRELDRLLRTRQASLAARHVGAAQALAMVLGTVGALDTARLARWRLDRANREAEDARLLRHYTRRSDAEAAFEALLSADDGRWVLHYRGDGGVGKTMLVRYLASGRFAADRFRPAFPVARVDFDHLDPRYPDDRPAEILLRLADDLVTFVGGYDLTKRYQRFHGTTVRLHEELSRRAPVRANVDRLLGEVVAQFGRMVRELPGPVVLVLDTCEELAKLYAPGVPAPAIDRTFQVLESIHAYAPNVRVVLAGRRPLVVEPDSAVSGPLLRERPYVDVHPLTGYTRKEAEAYLERLATPLSVPLRDAVLERVVGAADSTYNPFELTSYAEWAATDTSLTPEALRAEPGDLYVDRRIIGRLEPIVRDSLPAAAAFGRFDLELLAPELRRRHLDPQAAFDALCGHEWVRTLSVTAAGRPAVVQIDPHLLDRIRRAAAHVDPHRLGKDAAEVVEGTALTDLPAETIEAAVALLPAADAARLWQGLDERILAERAWGWAAQVTVRVAAVAAAARTNILAAILATQASANLHTGAVATLPTLWVQVAALADRHPTPDIARELAMRAALGLDTPLWRVPADLADRLADAAIAAAERSLDGGRPLHGAAVDLVSHLALTHPSTTIRVAAALILAGHHRDSAARHAGRAAEQCVNLPAEPDVLRDWLPPARLADRCALALMVTNLPTAAGEVGPSPDDLHDLHGVDAERRVAAWLGTRLAHGSVPAHELDAIEQQDVYVPGRRATSWIHYRSRPLRVVLAEAWGALGRPGRAAAALDARIEEAVAAGDDPETVEACQLALLRLCRRYRTTAYASSVHRLARDGSQAIRAEAWLVLTLVDGERPADPAEAGSHHGWWRCLDAAAAITFAQHDVPVDGSAASHADRLEHQVLHSRLRTGGDAAAPPPRLWPEDLADDVRAAIASGFNVGIALDGIPAGLAGRAALEAGEVAALRLPHLASAALRFASAALERAGFAADAARAMVLAILADRRIAETALPSQPLGHLVDGIAAEAWPDGWQERADAAAGTPPGPDARGRSPELPPRGRESRADVPRLVRALLRPAVRAVLHAADGHGVPVVAGVALIVSATGANYQVWQNVLVLLPVLGFVTTMTWAIYRTFALVRSFGPSYLVDLRQVGNRWFLNARPMRHAVDLSPDRLGRWFGAERYGNQVPPSARYMMLAERGYEAAALTAICRAVRPGRERFVTDSPLLNRRRTASSERKPSVVALHLDQAASTVAWEQRLGLAVPRERQAAVLWFRRQLGRFDAPHIDQWQQAPLGVGSEVHAMASGPAWPTVQTVRVLRLRGAAVPTSAGWRLRMTDAVPSADLLDLSRLRKVRAGLVVLQAELTAGNAKPLEDQHAGLLALAQDAADAGAPAVLVVPHLTHRLDHELHVELEKFAAHRWPPTPTRVLQLVRRLKAKIDHGNYPAPHTGHVAALDVILLMRTHE